MENATHDTRTALLLSALACFAEHGFDGTSTRMIADHAQRPLSLLAHYFRNKEGMYLEVFQYLFETKLMRKGKPPIPDEGFQPRDKQDAIRILRELIHDLFADIVRDPRNQDPLHELGSRLWIQEVRAPRESLRPLLTQHLTPVAATMKSCIQTLRPDLSECEARFAGASIMGMMTGHGFMSGLNRVVWGESLNPASQFEACERLVDLALNGLLSGTRP
ncbi:TetR/AcrR family transcriptional regulator [Mesoterricola silvestris]|uniref:HTH tetR-type domain-containing protein n=1 Tax=Mesoterricola silvestris TaxID=2927979 RepID=A0AA48KAN7_9BACT|nr:TetR/AcrR family transcriptional regulator [Mesoterricola silvestris]BDU71678.1 hypothetical protein METEAL_08520 [Mesoterricola silvestris]